MRLARRAEGMQSVYLRIGQDVVGDRGATRDVLLRETESKRQVWRERCQQRANTRAHTAVSGVGVEGGDGGDRGGAERTTGDVRVVLRGSQCAEERSDRAAAAGVPIPYVPASRSCPAPPARRIGGPCFPSAARVASVLQKVVCKALQPSSSPHHPSLPPFDTHHQRASYHEPYCIRRYAPLSEARKVAPGTFATSPPSACTTSRKMTII